MSCIVQELGTTHKENKQVLIIALQPCQEIVPITVQFNAAKDKSVVQEDLMIMVVPWLTFAIMELLAQSNVDQVK